MNQASTLTLDGRVEVPITWHGGQGINLGTYAYDGFGVCLTVNSHRWVQPLLGLGIQLFQ